MDLVDSPQFFAMTSFIVNVTATNCTLQLQTLRIDRK